MTDKEQLITLVTMFANLLKMVETHDVDDDELRRLATEIENTSAKVFGEKIPVDFGMIHLIYENVDGVIQYIEDYVPEVDNDWNPHPRNDR